MPVRELVVSARTEKRYANRASLTLAVAAFKTEEGRNEFNEGGYC